MLAIVAVTAALALGHADGPPSPLPIGIAFSRHDEYANRVVTWDGRVGAFDPYTTQWSPDGRYVARYGEHREHIERANGTITQVFDNPQSDVSWTRDASKLVLVQAGDVVVANGDGTDPQIVPVDVPGCGVDCAATFDQPTFSPDGTTIALLVTQLPANPTEVYKNVTAELFTVPVGGGTATPLAADDACPGDAPLEWSADSAWVAVLTNPCDNGVAYTLETASADGKTVGVSVTGADDWAWAPTGSLLAVQTRRGVALATPRRIFRRLDGARSPAWAPHDARLVVEWKQHVDVLATPNARPVQRYTGSFPTWTTRGIAYTVPQCGPRQGIWLGTRRLTNTCEVDGPHGTRWRDEIWAIDRKREHISCGSGFDIAHVDADDIVARDCERVIRK